MKKSILFILFVLPIALSCRKKDANKIDGPNLNDVYGAFSIITPLSNNLDSVDFSIGETVTFAAEFSKIVDWEITITGQTSGAVKSLTGTSSIVSAGSAVWNGSTTIFPMFQTEMCDVQLTITGESDVLTSTIKVIQPKVNQGFLIADFESGLNPGWSSFVQSGADMDFQIKTDSFAPQGNSYYNMEGTVNWDYLIGYLYFGATAYGAPQFPVSNNPDNTYFNVLIYGEPGLVNTILLFQFQEDDDLDGTFDNMTEDMYSLEIPVNWSGWKLVSIKYSDIPCLVNGQPAAPNGDGQHNPNKIQQLNMLDLANPISGNAKTKVDYLIMTENEPLEP